ncbi:MAG: tRNA (adenosine(37)-N6)-threonylcarbamoyltransferase complex transferase subunit TsaD [Candidatus Portnoybacteria bacterium RIFCSPLOWO2_02_FULL_40_15]|uniref:tRNA N6-adenosine threonylcarbamoyltransferase n=1 Tax=Candidatus Portnoybacteria bacterium RIFCSPLOWO2_02_FULL_40_15 TaxID=1802002 RepID=A0A1G2FQB7_9BACT|nr:MAG: tRNA (adenosine(37)-N6)-threonylcarbamoyltransferase complex transferase subunit TsaD [Candidatus Portnoybacteria bacterium RIFCSPLOWO2_02_FULL_40_15]
MIILGIETSCDDTCAAVVKRDKKGHKILSNVVSSQVKVHAPFGGIVPNLAAREHLKNIRPCLEKALKDADVKPKHIDLIAVTIGPGLIPSLLVGTNFAKALAYAWKKPIIGINHIEGHIYANWLKPVGENYKLQIPNSKNLFPALCLVVSGGHTQLILMKGHRKYKLLGETRDDAAGEAFDKTAKLLGLGYPGGPIISKLAQKGNIYVFDLPRPMLNSKNYDFSFSGLKTAVLYLIKNLKKKNQNIKSLIPAIAAEFQQAAIDVLINKTIKAAKEYKVKTIMLSGGVAANQELRKQMTKAVKKEIPNSKFYVPDSNLCTDNAAMIAAAAYYHKKISGKTKTWSKIQSRANLPLA